MNEWCVQQVLNYCCWAHLGEPCLPVVMMNIRPGLVSTVDTRIPDNTYGIQDNSMEDNTSVQSSLWGSHVLTLLGKSEDESVERRGRRSALSE